MGSSTAQQLRPHPAASIFPLLGEDEFDALVADIREHGQITPITVDADGRVLDGRNRLKACRRLGLEPRVERVDADDPVALVLSLNLVRRHLSAGQRAFVALEVKKRFEKEARRRMSDGGKGVKSLTTFRADEKAARLCRTNRSYVAQAARLMEHAPDLARDVQSGASDLVDAVKEMKRRARSAAECAGARRFARSSDQVTVVRGDFRRVGDAVADESVSLIFTDPPYTREHLPVYSDLGEFAARVLRPGGSLVCYVGNYALPDSVARLSEHLRYWWTLGAAHGGHKARMRAHGIYVQWKPLLWFVKGQRAGRNLVNDMVRSSPTDKDRHPWEQSPVEARYYIEQLTTAGDLVVDPFCGGGTTAAAALELRRKVWTCDVDGAAVKATRARLGM